MLTKQLNVDPKAVRAHRRAREIPQAEVAVRTRVSVAQLSMWERGYGRLHPDQIRRIAEYIGFSLDEGDASKTAKGKP